MAEISELTARMRQFDDEARRTDVPLSQALDFETVYTAHCAAVFRYLRARIDHEQDALDVFQTVFMRAFSAYPRYRRGQAPIEAWLLRIARNAVVDYYRKARSTDGLEMMTEPHSITDDPETTALREESIRHVHLLLTDEDDYVRELLALRFAGGLTVPEISKLLGKPEGTVKSDIRRALQRMKGKLGQNG